MRVIATAGHVDHGKSTLVLTLTGRDPDRWAEEQRRGLTIGLGFAWTTTPGGRQVAFVDVPGHERFIRTMVAGVGPAQIVMFVVAADEGWMPQSAEHLAVLDALGVRHGVIVITRCDLADPGPAARRATEEFGRTSLRDARTVCVSARTGDGMDDLLAALDAVCAETPDPDARGDVRLWIDRSFSVRGAGTVVTGTLTAGTLRVGDNLGHRVRGLHTLDRPVEQVTAMSRVAVNLHGTDHRAFSVGDTLTTPGAWITVTEIDIAVRPTLPREATVHIGTAAVQATVRRLGGDSARLRLARPLPLRVGDRLLVRSPGDRATVGADVLDVRPPRLTRRGEARRRDAELAELAGRPAHEIARAHLRRRVFAAETDFAAEGLPATGRAVHGWRIDPDALPKLTARAIAATTQWLAEHPMRMAGMPLADLARAIGAPSPEVAAEVARNAGLPVAGGRLANPARLPDAVEHAIAAVGADLATAPFRAPTRDRLAAIGLTRQMIRAAEAAGRVLVVARDLVLLPGDDERALAVLAALPQPFPVAAATTALGSTRRVVVPLLELLDAKGRTQRLPDGTRLTVDRDISPTPKG
ncbi:selenocysteine-specific translation elongation factor [Actinokineospora sp.]|uniref:selenocysteine-specific translation elongation factor n=1 Tax=Actinokineospora sp. TaxID=1872133 RepID=UPI003D6B6B2A